MKIVINTCYGGYTISALAIKELAKIKGKECYFFDFKNNPIGIEEASKSLMFFAYSVPNPQDYKLEERDADGLFGEANKRADLISLSNLKNNRSDSDLISIIEKLGTKANTKYSKLKIIEIPDGTEYEIEEYDGMEHVSEKHKTWS